MSYFLRYTTVLFIAGACMASLACPPASAQFGWGNTDRNKAEKQIQDAEFKSQVLNRPMSLPGVPSYTGKQKFINGMAYPNAKRGPGYILNYDADHDQKEVLSWWTNALKMHNWKITDTDKTMVRGKNREGSTCTVTVDMTNNKYKDFKAKSCYTIFYHMIKKR